MVVAWLYNVIDKTLHGSVAYAEKASEIWTDLKERYSQGNEIRVHQLKREINLATQDNMNVTEYFTKLKTLWDELGAYQQIPLCSCSKDSSLSKFQEREKVHQFLLGLDSDQFGTVRSNILTMEPLPNLNKVYSMVLREESQQKVSNVPDNRATMEAAAFKALAISRSKPQTRPKCGYCQKLGHTQHQYYELIGLGAEADESSTDRLAARTEPCDEDRRAPAQKRWPRSVNWSAGTLRWKTRAGEGRWRECRAPRHGLFWGKHWHD